MNLPIVMTAPAGAPGLAGATWDEVGGFYPSIDAVRQIERASIRRFVEKHREYLRGRVLDFGAGKPGTCAQPQPYRDLVQGDYVPVDKDDFFSLDPRYDAVLCTQVLQYLDEPERWLAVFGCVLKPGGHLVLSYPTNWDEAESTDFHRFTRAGMERMLTLAKLRVVVHERRAEVVIGCFKFPLGYGCVAQK